MQKLRNFFAKLFNDIKRFFGKAAKWIRSLFVKDGDAESSEDLLKRIDAENAPSSDRSSTVVFSGAETVRKMDAEYKEEPTLHPTEFTGKDKVFSSAFKKKESKPLFTISIICTSAKFLMIALVVIGFACLGAVFGVANAYLGTTPDLDLEQLQDNALTSYIYDGNGELLTSYSGLENRDYATLDEIPDILEKAFISVEDVRFYHHSGVDFKRLLSSFVNNMSGSSKSGGSTITQQLIKNRLLTSERSYKRKIQEASLSLQLEKKYSKDQILEVYLNTISLGGTNYGVKAAAKDYFGKELDQLTLRECACIARITQYPYAYNPRRCYYGSDDPEETAERIEMLNSKVDNVLNDMYKAGAITLEERNAAMEDELVVIEKSTTTEMYECAHFLEYAVENVIDGFIEQRGLENTVENRQVIENELRTGGYRIYTTVDPDIQNIVQTSFEEYEYPALKNKSDNVIEQKDANGNIIEIRQPQAATVVMDQSTGQIKAMVGSRTKPTTRKTLNRAVSNSTLVGSSIKPLAVYGPAFEKGYGLGTVVENIKAPIEGWTTKEGYPTSSHGTKSSFGKKYGPVPLRNGIKSSLNIVAVRALESLVGVDDAYDTLVQLGIGEEKLNKDLAGMSMGTSGISMLELTAAYAAIANGGVYNEPMAFTVVRDSKGKVILDADNIQDSYRVYERSTAYMLVSALTDAVKGGTGTNAKISGITVAGKTGTNADNNGVVFAGMTGYYTSCVWTGHDNFKSFKKTSGGSGAAPLWQSYMSKILDGKEDKPILEGSAEDYDVVSRKVCSASGMLATEACAADISGHEPFSELFPKGTELEECTWHMTQSVCSASGQTAGAYCPAELITTGSVVTLPPDSPYYLLTPEEILEIFPNVTSTTAPLVDEEGNIIPSETDPNADPNAPAVTTCPIHTAEWAAEQSAKAAAIEAANHVLSRYNALISNYGILINSDTLGVLKQNAANLKTAVDAAESTSAEINSAANILSVSVDAAQDMIDMIMGG